MLRGSSKRWQATLSLTAAMLLSASIGRTVAAQAMQHSADAGALPGADLATPPVVPALAAESARQAPELATEPAAYREAIDQAVLEFAAGNYKEARAMFARAHTLSPNARTQRGLGMAEFELKDYSACVAHLEAALVSPVRPLNEKLRAETVRMLDRANSFVARYVVDAKPAFDALRLDGLPVDLGPDRVLLVNLGEHTLELYTAGYVPEHRRLSVKSGGDFQHLTILFSKPTPVATLEKRADSRPRRWYENRWLWGAVGVVAAGAATGTAIALSKDDSKVRPVDGGSSQSVLGSP